MQYFSLSCRQAFSKNATAFKPSGLLWNLSKKTARFKPSSPYLYLNYAMISMISRTHIVNVMK